MSPQPKLHEPHHAPGAASPAAKPIASYLADFDAPPPRPAAPPPVHASRPVHASPPANASQNAAPAIRAANAPAADPHMRHPASAPHPMTAPHLAGGLHSASASTARPLAPAREAVEVDEDALSDAFARGKEEGLKLAEARHALERRRRENEEGRRAAERVAEAEARVGALLAERLSEEVAALERRLSGELAMAVVPFLRNNAERVALDDLLARTVRLAPLCEWSLSGPPRLIEAFERRLGPDMRERARLSETDGMDLAVEVGEARLSTRLGELARALEAMGRAP